MFPILILLLSLLVSSGSGLGQCLDRLAHTLTGTTSPSASTTDTDGDGLTDAFELKYGLNPNSQDSNGNGLLDPAENPDGDGLSNYGEQLFGTNPKKADTDGDGVEDGKEDSNHNGRADELEQDRRPVPYPITPTLNSASNDFVCYRKGVAGSAPCNGDPAGTLSVVIYGDSHAAQWLPALDGAGKTRHWRVTAYAKEHCPSVHVAMGADCAEARQAAEAKMQADPPDLIILSNFSHYGTPTQTWVDGLNATFAALPSASKVMVLEDTPLFTRDVPTCLRRHPDNIGICEVASTAAYRTDLDDQQQTAAVADGASVASMNPWVCPYALCPVIVGHKELWRDSHHMTATYSRQLAPAFGALVAAALRGTP
jgi:hypothetical protein